MELKKRLEENIRALYKNDAEKLLKNIYHELKRVKPVEPLSDNPYWFKFIDLYFIYPDGVIYNKNDTPLQNLIPHLEHIKNLGVNALHILPFLESPMIDRGFDISDYYKVRKDLGTLKDLEAIKKRADELHIRLFMDLVFNHVSDQHEWFQKAQRGNKTYRDYFITTKEKPEFIKKYHKDAAVWADYKVNGKIISVNIAFPEYTGPIPHWREGKDGYWYYHTYYPEQPDLNWKNPQVFLEVSKVLMYWAEKGFSFRLDAIPFVGKSAYKQIDADNKATYFITAALKAISEMINHQSVFVVETYEQLNTVLDYFGTSNRIQANLSYNFHLCTNIWVSLIKEDSKFMWDKLKKQHEIPKHGEWLNFLRNHDELSLAYLSEDTTKEVREAIIKHGENFREGYGVSGRTYPFLDFNNKRFLMSYFLLASFPGGMVIPYGDEIAHKNIPLSKLREIDRRDTRNINRGVIPKKAFTTKKAKRIMEHMKTILQKRNELRDYLNVWPSKIKTTKEVFGACYHLGASELMVYINLSKKRRIITKDLKGFTPIATVNTVKTNGHKIHLGPYGGVWLQK